jgi:hypothetical protein
MNGASWTKENFEREQARLKSWRESNVEACKAYNKAYREAHYDKLNERVRKWFEDNPERARENQKAWRKANPKKCAAFSAAWRKANPDSCNARNRRAKALRRVRIDNSAVLMSYVEKLELRVLYEEAALLGPGWHVDHIIPLSQGGDHRPYNMQIVRDSYNKSKNAKLWYTPADLGKHLPAHYAEAAM